MNSPLLEIEDLKLIKQKSKADPSFDADEALRKHAAHFSFLGYREPFSKGFDFDFFKKKFDDLDLNQVSNVKDEIIERLHFSEDEQVYIKLLKEFVYFRNYRTEKLYEALYYSIETLWKNLGIVMGLENDDLGYFTLKEIDNLLNNNVKIDPETINERKKGYAFLMNDGIISLVVGKELQDIKNEYSIIEGKIRELTGMVACKGTAKGTVKIVLKASEQLKMDEGDVLVTSMTTPDFVPSMKKAIAIITDEGGITCHAAIVSRELGIPCIIGTKVATKILKDGDVVEVDAMAGIVRMIKH
jgi:phosphohistidine swiveling domain-containing protein